MKKLWMVFVYDRKTAEMKSDHCRPFDNYSIAKVYAGSCRSYFGNSAVVEIKRIL